MNSTRVPSHVASTFRVAMSPMTERRKNHRFNYSSLAGLGSENPSKIPKTHTERVLDRQMQRRNLVKIDKPEPKPQNVVLQMLQ